MNSSALKNYWDLLADQFQHQQPPLRPGAEDIRMYEQAVQDRKSRLPHSSINALLFGVTPEIVSLAWPTGTHLLAVEKSQPMIDRFWPGDIPGQRQVLRENWFNLDLEENSLDLVMGDGGPDFFELPGSISPDRPPDFPLVETGREIDPPRLCASGQVGVV